MSKKIVAIQNKKGSFVNQQGQTVNYNNYNLICQLSELKENDFGFSYDVIKVRAEDLNNIVFNHKLNSIGDLIGFKFEEEYYDAYSHVKDFR